MRALFLTGVQFYGDMSIRKFYITGISVDKHMNILQNNLFAQLLLASECILLTSKKSLLQLPSASADCRSNASHEILIVLPAIDYHCNYSSSYPAGAYTNGILVTPLGCAVHHLACIT